MTCRLPNSSHLTFDGLRAQPTCPALASERPLFPRDPAPVRTRWEPRWPLSLLPSPASLPSFRSEHPLQEAHAPEPLSQTPFLRTLT